MDASHGSQCATILLVDDNEMGRQVIHAMLEKMGACIIVAINGIEAVAVVEKVAVDLILMDIQMPVMDGLDATKEIRKLNSKVKAVPIIAMTANCQIEQQDECYAAGMNGHISKPVEIAVLFAELMRWLPAGIQLANVGIATAENLDNRLCEVVIPEIDVASGMRHVSGDLNLYLKLLRRFVKQFSDWEQGIHAQLASGDKDGAIRAAHTLRGVAGGLGAKNLQLLAEQLELSFKESDYQSKLPLVTAELELVLVTISNLLKDDNSNKVEKKSISSELELMAILEQFFLPLNKLQVHEATQLLTRIQENEWPDDYTKQLTQLENYMEQYQYKLAVKLVETLLSDLRSSK